VIQISEAAASRYRNKKLLSGVYAVPTRPCRSVRRFNRFNPEGTTPMKRTVLTMAAAAIGLSVAIAQSDPLSQRKALMKSNGQHAGALGKMVRGEDAFDAAKVNAAFAQWTEAAQKLPTLFPEPPKAGEETRALPKIWEDKADFNAKIAAFAKVVGDNKGKATTLDELKVAMPLIGKGCGNCHELYRRPAPGKK
jgi:cytochrome c556